jgi:hypothetical protein
MLERKGIGLEINISKTLHQINISCMIKSKRMRWTGHIACMGEMRCIQNIGKSLKRRGQLEGFCVDGKIILK